MRARKIDANQSEIVNGLRKMGCSVAITSAAGDGFPDLVVGYYRNNYLLEVKDGNKSPSKRRLNPEQEQFHINWNGQIAIVESLEQAIEVVIYSD